MLGCDDGLNDYNTRVPALAKFGMLFKKRTFERSPVYGIKSSA